MTKEEAISKLMLAFCKERDKGNEDLAEALAMGIAALDQEPKIESGEDSYDFVKWVATEIFDDMWDYNKDAFVEIACRKLAKLGIVRAKDDEWELVEPQESEE